MPTMPTSEGLPLSGLDGSNPLGFLAAVGTLCVLDQRAPGARLAWCGAHGSWRPLLVGCRGDEQEVSSQVLRGLKENSDDIFRIGKESEGGRGSHKFPFASGKFVEALNTQSRIAHASDRRHADFLAALGTDFRPDTKSGEFQDTRFRMVRAGDSAQRGMLSYASANRELLDHRHVVRTLFQTWDYADDEGNTLRWDPIEDRRYALQWRNPSKSNSADSPNTMLAANCLAVESLACFPTVATINRADTTGFRRFGRHEIGFVWPIWTSPISVQTVRSLVALERLHEEPLPRKTLHAQGIEDVYCARRVRPNKYYSNFAPAEPLL